MRKILLFLFLACIGTSAFSQSTSDLTEDEKKQVELRIIDKLEDFQFHLGLMANKRKSQQVRTAAHKSNVLLFIGKCEPYTVTNISTGESEKKEAIQMETSSVSNGRERKRSQPMKQYFINIMNNRTYSNIKIEQSKAVRVDNFRKIADDKYEAVAHIHQYFTGYGGERNYVIYSDNTEKAVRILIDYHENRTSEGIDRIFDIKLGDMKVALTERLK